MRRAWPWLAVTAVISIAFGIPYSGAASSGDQQRLLISMAIVLGVVAILAGAFLLAQASKRDLVISCLLAAAVTAWMFLGSNSSAGTAACKGPNECDTAFAVGALIVIPVISLVYLLLVGAGRLLGRRLLGR